METFDKTLVVTRISEICQAINLNLKQLAAACDIPYSTFQRYSSGTTEPRAELFTALFIKIGISLDWFVSGQGEMFRADYNRQANAQNAVKQAVTAATAPTSADLSKREVRLCQFVRWWMDTHEPDDQVWFEKQIERAVPEYAEWKKEQ